MFGCLQVNYTLDLEILSLRHGLRDTYIGAQFGQLNMICKICEFWFEIVLHISLHFLIGLRRVVRCRQFCWHHHDLWIVRCYGSPRSLRKFGGFPRIGWGGKDTGWLATWEFSLRIDSASLKSFESFTQLISFCKPCILPVTNLRLAIVSKVELWNFFNSAISLRLSLWVSRNSQFCCNNRSWRSCWSRRWSSSAWAQWSSSCWDSILSPNFRTLLLSLSAWNSCFLISASHSAGICSVCLSNRVLICAALTTRHNRTPCSLSNGSPRSLGHGRRRLTDRQAFSLGVIDMYSVCFVKHILERGVNVIDIHEEPLLGELLVGQGLCVGLDVSLLEVVGVGLITCVGEGLVSWPHLLVGGVHSVTTYPRGRRKAAGAAGDWRGIRRVGSWMEWRAQSRRVTSTWCMDEMSANTRTTWATRCGVQWVSMTTTRTNKKTTCTYTCQVSRFMCFVLVLVFTSSLVSDVLSFGFTTHT